MEKFLVYIDPGSGSYLVQALIAALLGIGFFFKNISLFVRAKFSRFFRNKQ